MSENTDQEPVDPNQEKAEQSRSTQINGEDDPTRIHIHKNPAELLGGLAGFFRSILSLREGAFDVQNILKNVREGIVFKGYNVWILFCAIIIASVGLNMDSTAVIIGAMLISPLMGPIRGIGFGVGINDFKLLTESLKNFGITVAISLLASFIYFLVTPIDAVTENIFARTEPNFLDVIIAFVGGLAGIIAVSKNKADTVIPGVAIATALMPPLCTAGYGLAVGNWTYFLGAGYLFLLNTILIAASTYVLIRYLKFPKKEYLNPKIERRVKAYTLVFIIVAIGPSIYMFYRMTKISIFEANADRFVEEVIEKTDDNIKVEPVYNFDWKNSSIVLNISNYYANDEVIGMWKRQLGNYDIEYADLKIKQGDDILTQVKDMFVEYDQGNKGANTLAELLSQRENQLVLLQKEVERLKENPVVQPDPMQFSDLLSGFRIDYPEYEYIGIDRSFSLNKNAALDTVYAVKVRFRKETAESERSKLNSKLSRRVKLELKQKANFRQDSVYVYTIDG